MDHYSLPLLNQSINAEPPLQVLALTKENLSLIEQDTEPSLDILSRYYNSLLPPTPSSARRERRASSTYSVDTVMAPPRLVSFPYHNDSLFLPTVEHPSSLYSSTGTPASSLDNLTLLGSYRPTTPVGSLSSVPSNGRRASTTVERRPSPLGTFPPRRFNSAPPFEKTQRMLSNVSPSDTIPFHANRTAAPEKPKKKKQKLNLHWLTDFAKLFKKHKSDPKASSTSTTTTTTTATTTTTTTASTATVTNRSSCRMSEKSPVWYSQYTANPPPPVGLAVVSSA